MVKNKLENFEKWWENVENGEINNFLLKIVKMVKMVTTKLKISFIFVIILRKQVYLENGENHFCQLYNLYINMGNIWVLIYHWVIRAYCNLISCLCKKIKSKLLA